MEARKKSSRPAFLAMIGKSLASLQLAVVLIVVMAVVLAGATILESAYGREYAQWFVYGSRWFVVLLGLLGLNILAATIIRYPWKKRIPFLVTHSGLLLLLFGSMQTFLSGTEGRLAVVEGESCDTLTVPTRTRFSAAWPERREGQIASFLLRPGPVDWPDGETLDLGELNDVHLRVLKYMRRALVERSWAKDRTSGGPPAIEFALHDPGGKRVQREWLLAQQFGSDYTMGPATFRFRKLAVASMVDDFLSPPNEGLGEMGILSIHHAGKVRRVSVEDHLGKRIALEDSEISVEIAEYLPNSVPSGNAEFKSAGDAATNPMLEILIYPSEDSEPVRQIAFALHPLLSFDGIHGRTSPVKFWYHHPAPATEAATEFVQSPDGTLYSRAVIGDKYRPHGKVELNELLPTAAGFHVSVLQHFPSAREKVTVHSVPPDARGADDLEAAALLEVRAGDITRQLWMVRQDPTYGSRTVKTPAGILMLEFGYDEVPLDFSLELIDFQRSRNPGSMGDASFKSQVRLVDRKAEIDEEAEISMNRPLTHDTFTFYQSSYQELPSGKQASIFTVAYDPGRPLKYLGSIMICLGSFAMFYVRRLGLRRGRSSHAASGENRRKGSPAVAAEDPPPLATRESRAA